MTQSKRIFLNTIATYGRSMFGVLCGIFSTRWVLEALGQVDFGLYGLIGSMVMFIAFLNIQFSAAIARYYAYSIGEAKVSNDSTNARNECRAWFSTAVFIHTIGPLLLVSVGYPLGIYAIGHNWLNIPVARMEDCECLWGMVCAATFCGMANVPFTAMYTAKQYIAELTIYSFAQTIVKTAVIYYMASHPGDWLIRYGLWMAIISIVPEVLIAIRALVVFPECRIRKDSVFCCWRIARLGSFAFWQGVGGIGYVAAHQMMNIIITRIYGPRMNASFSVSQTVAGEAASLTGALQGAFAPAITTAYGAGDLQGMREMAYRVSKMGTLLTLMFAIPAALEIDEILKLWLKDPPAYASEMCLCTLSFIVLEKLTCGHITAVNAGGRVAKFHALRGVLRTSVVPMALFAGFCDMGVVVTVAALPLSVIFVDLGDVLLARRSAGLSVRYWISKVVLPLFALSSVAYVIGSLPKLLMDESLLRVLVTTAFTLLAFVPLVWLLVLDVQERLFFHKRICRILNWL